MEKRNAILLVWAVVATIAAIWLALSPEPTVAPGKSPPELIRTEPERTEPGRPRRPRSAESLEGFLALALAPPVPEEDDGRPVAERVRALFKEHLAHTRILDHSSEKALEIYRKLGALVAFHIEAHPALMEILAEAEDEDTVHEVLSFLIWSPFAKLAGTYEKVTRAIKARAKEVIASDPSVARREGAIRVLFRYRKYDPDGRANFDFGLERLEVEPSIEVRDVLLEEMSVAGTRHGLTREEAAPFVERLRARFEEGVVWCAVVLADWSTDADDFRRIREKLATERGHHRRGQVLLDAFSGDKALVRDRSEEAQEVLIGVLADPTANGSVRSNARTLLTTTFGPLDAASAEAVRRYDAEQEGR